MSVHAHTSPERKELARTSLKLANDQYRHHRHHRESCARSARGLGFTNQEIADIYGVTEAAVRAMVKRAAARL